MKICAVYARVSTDMQGESLQNQVDYAKEYIRRLGTDYRLDESRVYTDFDQSGYYTRFLQRPAIQQALEDARNKAYDVIVFKEISRISRDQAEHIEIVSRFSQCGIRMIAINDNLDSDRPETLDLLGIHSVMSEMESKRISSRVSSGKKSLARRGLWVGEAPIGYLVDSQTRRLAVDPAHSLLPQLIFRLYTQEGFGTLKIAAHLNQNRMFTKHGRPWSRVTVNRVLRNPAYVGDLVYGRTRNTLRRIFSDQGYTKVQGRDPLQPSDWVVVRNTHPALVERAVFDRAQSIMEARSHHNPRRSSHPLTGLLQCGRCHSGMICQRQSSGGKVYRYYTCARAFRLGRQSCDQPNLKAEEVEQVLLQFIITSLQAYSDADFQVESTCDGAQQGNTLERLERELRKAQTGLERLLTDRDIPEGTFTQLKANYLHSICSIEEEMERVRKQHIHSQTLDIWQPKVSDFLQELRTIDMSDLDEIRRIFHGFFQSICVNGREISDLTLRHALA